MSGCSLLWLSLGALLIAAGCLGSNPPAGSQQLGADDAHETLQVPWPTTNVTYTYEAQGSEVAVELDRVATRKGPWLEDHTGWTLHYTYATSTKGDETWHFEETVDPDTGLAIQQWARCAVWEPSEEGDDSWECMQARGEAIPSAWGFPAALGAAPFWGTNLTPGNVDVSIHPLVGPEGPWSFTAGQALGIGPGPNACLRLQPVHEDHRGLRALMFAGGMHRFTLCEGDPFPVAFTSNEGRNYELVDRSGDPGDQLARPPPEEGPPVADPEPPVPMVNRSPPIYAEHPERPTPFTTTEAHEVARDRVDTYDRLFAGGGQAILVRSWFDHQGGTSRADPDPRGDSNRYQRTIVAVDERGRWVEVVLEKHVHEKGEGPFEGSRDYEVKGTERGTTRGAVPQEGELARRQASIDAMVRLGESLTGRPFDERMGFGIWGSFKTVPTVEDPDGWRLNGSTMISWYEDPQPESSGGYTVTSPIRFMMDGPTGAVLSVQGPRDTLNETMR